MSDGDGNVPGWLRGGGCERVNNTVGVVIIGPVWERGQDDGQGVAYADVELPCPAGCVLAWDRGVVFSGPVVSQLAQASYCGHVAVCKCCPFGASDLFHRPLWEGCQKEFVFGNGVLHHLCFPQGGAVGVRGLVWVECWVRRVFK